MQFLRRSILGVLRPLRCERNLFINYIPRRLFSEASKFKTGAFLLSVSWLTSSDTSKVSKVSIQNLIKSADELFEQNKYREICDLLESHKSSENVEILWRLARAQYKLSQEMSINAEEKKKLIFESYDIIKKSLEIDENHFANHKWMSILLDARSTYDGIKARISNLENVKEHMLKASLLNPKDATILYMLGVWCYQIADMPWYQRKVASTIFAAPPESSYEDALVHFETAEMIDPNFYSQNLLMLGKTYMKLKNDEKAEHFLTLASKYPVANDDDILASQEASELLKKLKSRKTAK